MRRRRIAACRSWNRSPASGCSSATRGVRPTEAGLVLVRLARRILAETRRAEEELDRLAGNVAVGVLPVAAVGVLPGALIRLQAAQPALPMRSSQGFIRETLLATDLVSVMPRLMMAGDLLRGTLRVVPLPVPAPPRPAGLVLPRDRPLPAAGTAFVDALRTHLAELDAAVPAVMPDADRRCRRSNGTPPPGDR